MAGASKTLNYRVAVDASQGTAGIRDFSRAITRELKSVDSALDDTASSGAKVSAAMAKMADAARTELTQASAAADALAAALGPELAAALGRNGIANYVGDLTRLGLTFDDITADADQLAAGIRELESVKVDASAAGLGNLGGNLREVDDAARGAGSAMANMLGNSAQDMSAFAGVTGSAGVAIGQMAEYMSDAVIGGQDMRSSLAAMARVAGPIALLGLAVETVGNLIGAAREESELAARRVKLFGDALEDADDAAGNLVESLKDNVDLLTDFNAQAPGFGAGIVEGLSDVARAIPGLGALVGDAGENMANLIDIMQAAEFSARDFAEAVDAGGKVGQEWSRTLLAAVDAGKITEDQYESIAQAISKYGIEADKAKEIQAFFAASSDDAAKKSGFFADNLEDVVGGFDDVEDSGRNARDQIDLVKLAYDQLTGRIDAKRSVLDLRDQFDRLADSAQSAWDKTVAGEDDAEQAQRDYQREMLNTQSLVADYARQLGGLPPDRVTAIIADIDDGSIRTADQLLERLARERQALITVRVLQTPHGGAGPGTVIPASAMVPAVAGLAAAAPAAPATAPAATSTLLLEVPSPATSVVVDMRGALLASSRYELVRAVRDATAAGVRLAGTR